MPLEAPKLNNSTFEQIKERLRSRIPRFTPEWTDFNESDPGIALMEMFAWLTEMLLYQMNRIPEANYIKFLKLLNMELAPPIPAEAHLSFTVKPGSEVKPVPARSQVAAQSAETGELITFETEEGLDLVPYALSGVQVYDGAAFAEVTEANTIEGNPYYPFGWMPQVGNALYLGFTPPDPLPAPGQRLFPQRLSLRVFLPSSALAGKPQSCLDAAKVPFSDVKLLWEYRHGKSPHPWRPLTVFKDETLAFTREGYILLEGPAEIAATREGNFTEEPLFWLRCRLNSNGFPAGKPPEIDSIRFNTVSALSLATMRDEVLDPSKGHPNQSFELRHKPIHRESLTLRVETSDSDTETWLQKDDFLDSGPNDPHYVLERTTGTVRFGDGKRGRIPVAGAQIIATEYRYGGGHAANVPAGAINIPLSPLPGLDTVTNERPAVGGKDEQDPEDLKGLAPLVLCHRNRAVTPEDFQTLAKEAGGVARAKAMPLAHPDFPGVKVPGAVTIVIVPETGGYPPEPSSDLIRHVCGRLDNYRLLTTEVYVKGPRYVEICVDARIEAKPYVAAGTVEERVREALNERLNPLEWEFGRNFHPTGLYRDILRVMGDRNEEIVSNVIRIAITVDGQPHELENQVELEADQLVCAGRHIIKVVPEEDS